jgi:hypothetical protein
MGDAVQNDGEYPSQAAEPGILGVTEGHYHERHAGGLMELMGNMGSDPNQPIPAMRQRVQINPSLGAPHILNTVNAHEHAVDLSSAQVTENKTLTTDTLTHTLAAPDYFVTHAQDESRGIYVNQVHAQTGTNNLLKVNTLCLSTTAQNRSLRQTGLQRRDQYQNKILNLNHSQNNLQYETLTQSIGRHNKQTSVEAMSVQNYTRTHQQSTQQASSIIQQNNSWQSDVSQTYFGDSMNMHSGSASLLAPDSVVMLNECFIQATQSGSSSEGLLSSRE